MCVPLPRRFSKRRTAGDWFGATRVEINLARDTFYPFRKSGITVAVANVAHGPLSTEILSVNSPASRS